MLCPFCREEIKDGAIKCKHCGSMLNTTAPSAQAAALSMPNSGKSRTTAAILAFVLGGIGVHKFYLGSWGWGLMYLLFCWTYIPCVAAFVEFIRYLILSPAQFQEKVNNLNGPFSYLW